MGRYSIGQLCRVKLNSDTQKVSAYGYPLAQVNNKVCTILQEDYESKINGKGSYWGYLVKVHGNSGNQIFFGYELKPIHLDEDDYDIFN